ncbi:histidine phosphatase family protein [Streptococcus oricebi]|uniref:Histidine phosphatase family protein n=1 Tax=Streptococcus oricebi TaxID=1547447 RepID=A0ABS5B6K8_9STRE|nr:histidine phosphatase family protein [Streptococcus oricebi]MBP2624131.1 histidine phosphatase family protein [Streptococcus oricebi]
MGTTVYFVRHAEPNYNNHDDASRELSRRGLQDAQKLVNFFSNIIIDNFYSSPYKRAIDTIQPLAQARQKKIALVDNFCERKIDDVWIEDFESFSERQWADFSYKLENGESLAQVQKRNIEALEHLLGQNKQTILIASHGTALSTIVNYYQPSFGYENFQEIKSIFPWIVKIKFDGLTNLSITSYTEIGVPL